MRSSSVVLLAVFCLLTSCGEQRTDVGPTGAGGQTCDISTEKAALATYARLRPDGEPLETACAKLLPDLESAIVGGQAFDIGCGWREVVHRCEVFPLKAASGRVLSNLGWKQATDEERARLALRWTQQAAYARETILEEATDGFGDRPFTPPSATATGDGGVKVTVWVRTRPQPVSGSRTQQHEVVYDAAGAIVSDEVKDTLGGPPRPRSDPAPTPTGTGPRP